MKLVGRKGEKTKFEITFQSYLFWVVGQWGPRDHQTLKVIAITFGHPPKLDNKTLLLKISFVFCHETWRIQTSKISSYWLDSIVIEDAIHATVKEKKPSFSLRCKPWQLQ